MNWNTQAHIQEYEKREETGHQDISLDEAFRLSYIILDDVKQFNGKERLSDVKVHNDKAFIQAAYRIMERALDAVDDNKSAIDSLSKIGREDFQDLEEQVKEKTSELQTVVKDLEEQDAVREKLKKTSNELEETRGSLLYAKEECEKYRARIEILSDSALDEAGKLRDDAKAEAERREAKSKELTDSIEKIRKKNSSLAEELKSKDQEVKDQETILAKTKESIQKTETRKKEIEDLLTQLKNGNEDALELETKYAYIVTAFSSFVHDDQMLQNIFANGEREIKVSEIEGIPKDKESINSAEDVMSWLKTMQGTIEALLTVYQTTLINMEKVGAEVMAPVKGGKES